MTSSTLVKNLSWLTIASAVERVAALAQTVLLARALGITDYGIYGLIVGTIGMAASLAGMQMGLTATVFVARYRETEKEKAAFVIAFVNRFGIAIALAFLVIALPFSEAISGWLLGDSAHTTAVVAACVVVGLSVVGGIQDGVVQGFEDFRQVAMARLITTLTTLVLIYPAGVQFGLMGAMVVAVAALVIKFALLSRSISFHSAQDGLPAKGSGLRALDLLWKFSLPAMLVSLLTSFIGWAGSVALSRQSEGFDSLAIVSTGLQWRGPILFLAAVLGSVAIPAISRHVQRQDHDAIETLHRRMLLVTCVIASLVSLVLAVASPQLLALYGPQFVPGVWVFSLLVVSAVPQVVANVYLQHLVAKGHLWYQLGMHLWLVAPLAIGFAMLIPAYHALGFAAAHLAAWSIFALALAWFRKVPAQTPSEPVLPARAMLPTDLN